MKTEANAAGATLQRETVVNEAAAYGAQVLPAAPLVGAVWWRITQVRHLSPDENRGKHNVFVRVLDEHGRRVSDPRLRITWTWQGRRAEERADPAALDKREGELGHGDIGLEKGVHAEVWIQGDGLASDRVANLHTDHDIIEKTSDNQDGNSRYHHSYQVIFQRSENAVGPQPPPKPVLPGVFAFEVLPAASRDITQYFGANPANYATYSLAGHEGIDFAARSGSPVVAVATGTVRMVQSTDDGRPYGIHVRIDHAQGYQSIYAHLSSCRVLSGQMVETGEEIGKAGSTGNSTGPHLHFSLKKAGAVTEGYPAGFIDPLPFLLALID